MSTNERMENSMETTQVEFSIETEANKLVNRYMWWSMVGGLIPVPLVDIGAVTGVQLKMLSELSKMYKVEFSKNRGKSIVSALLGGVVADSMNRSLLTSVVKAIPVVNILGAVSMPIYSGAATYAIGKLFIQHFESGGTFLDFNPQTVKEYFKELYAKGQEVARNLTNKQAPAPAPAPAK
ncbi:MAG: YcjF family protein [Bacteroidota bacterium]